LTGFRFFAYHGKNGKSRVHGNQEIESDSAERTVELGCDIGLRLQRGDVVALHGPLGAGKTTLVKGIARSLSVDDPVTSPSFTLVAEYDGFQSGSPVVLYHVDLYRIGHPREIEDLGFEEIAGSGGITVVEWAEKASELLPETAIHIDIVLLDGKRRRLTIRGLGES
jgi:tRNA threonylcarbamoyladenosine biosynthesis protein TsaE